MGFSRCWQNWTGDRENRFPLLETLVVIVIILAVASLAIPTLLRVSAESNEASTVNSLRALNVACVEYATIYGRYPSALSDLGRATSATSTSADLVDAALASGAKGGYSFVYSSDRMGTRYTLKADPIAHDRTHNLHFYSDESGAVRFAQSGDADASSPTLK